MRERAIRGGFAMRYFASPDFAVARERAFTPIFNAKCARRLDPGYGKR
jgi:hypothetical protein